MPPIPKASSALCAGLALLASCVCAVVRADDSAPKRLTAHPRGETPIVIDGLLNEAAWRQAQIADDFVERTPAVGAPAAARTTVRMLYDHDALYVGVECFFPSGEGVKAHNRVRDSFRVWRDDAFTLKFDVRHDRRSSVGFALNPENSQVDLITVENGRVFRIEYDAIWQSQTHLADDHWAGELRIPVTALGMPGVDGERVIGFNISRDHNARIAIYDWSLMRPEFGPWAASHFGEVHGIENIATGAPLSIEPYVLLGYPQEEGSDLPMRVKSGGDIRLRLADDTWSELTVLTDFAQVDVDDQVVNLDRFALFFPERRPFFLSGLDVFEFGQPRVAQLLFTRRIGIDGDGRSVPILGGFKLYGTAGAFDYGLLDVVTGDTFEPAAAPDDSSTGQLGHNWSVARLRTNFEGPGHVGFLIGSRNSLDLPFNEELGAIRDEPHLSLGVDGTIRGLDQRLELSSFAAYTRDEELDALSEGSAVQGRLRWRGEVVQPEISTLRVSEQFEPELGFVRRPGSLDTRVTLPTVIRPGGSLSRITQSLSAQVVHDEHAEGLLTRVAAADLGFVWLEGFGVSAGGDHAFDVVEDEFDLLSDVEVRADRYEGLRLRTRVFSPSARNPSASLDYVYDDAFFGGHRHSITLDTSVSLGAIWRLAAGGTLSFLSLKECLSLTDADSERVFQCGRPVITGEPVGAIDRRTVAANTTLAFTPSTEMSADLTLQANTQTEQLVGLVRIRYRYVPGSDIFLIYQENASYGSGFDIERSLIFKAVYRYDTLVGL